MSVELTVQDKKICAGFIEAVILDVMDFVMHDRSEEDAVEIATEVSRRMIDELHLFDYQRFAARYK